MSISAGEVKIAANGHWEAIFSALAPSLKDAMKHLGKHVSCPHHGGTNGFRLFKDFQSSGGCVCNTCGTFSDGLATIGLVNGWDFPTTVAKVAEFLGLDQESKGVLTLYDKDDQFSVIGVVLDVGEAPYDFVEGRDKSFYVRMNSEGQKTVVLWGNALKQAFERSLVKTGEWAEFTKVGFKTGKSKDGKTIKRTVWSISKTLSPEERLAASHEATALDQKKEDRIDAVWNQAHALSDDSLGSKAVLAYLKNRGITLSVKKLESGDSLRAIDSFSYYEGKQKLGDYPAMVAAVRDCFGLIKTLHITYLTPEGRKAQVRVPKKLLALPSKRTISGCSIPFVPVKKMLAVAEGIETALSVSTGLGIPCWATISATGMSNLRIPNHVQYLLIMADKDKSETGYKAALELQKRMQSQGCDARIFVPELDIPEGAKGIDWNDALQANGKQAFILPGIND